MIFSSGSTTDNYKRIDIPYHKNCIIANDGGTNPLAFGVVDNIISGIIYPNEVLELRNIDFDSIFIKSYNSGSSTSFRFWAWGTREQANNHLNDVFKGGKY